MAPGGTVERQKTIAPLLAGNALAISPALSLSVLPALQWGMLRSAMAMVLASSLSLSFGRRTKRRLLARTAEGPFQAKGIKPDIKVLQELSAEARPSYSSWAGWGGRLC
jgi:hypothetical protein